jgi:hypothetical protein
LISTVDATNRPQDIRTALDVECGTRGQGGGVVLVYIETEEPIQTVGPAETTDDEALRLSRGIRRQR